jgi:hypothetical protein
MIDQMPDPIQKPESPSNKETYDADIFSKIKSTQSIPDEVVKNFLQSKGKLTKKVEELIHTSNEK